MAAAAAQFPSRHSAKTMDSSSSSSTNLDYFGDMWKLQSTATLLSLSKLALPFERAMMDERFGSRPDDFPSARRLSTCRFRRHRSCRFRHQIRSQRCAVQRSKDGIVSNQIRFSTTVSLRIPARKRRRNSRKGKRVVLCVDESSTS